MSQEQEQEPGILVIGRPHRGQVDYHWLDAYEQMRKPRRYTSIVAGHTLIDQARNSIVERALRSPDVSHILMIDDDIIAPPDGLLRLLAHREPIVSGLCFVRYPPYSPAAWWRRYREGSTRTDGFEFEILHDYPAGLQEVDGVGTAFLLVARAVYEAIPAPWFVCQYPDGEDLYFCQKAKAAGFRVYLDADVKCGHLTTAVITERSYLTGHLGWLG